MVAVVTGNELGLFNTFSRAGQAGFGQGNEQVYVNASTGNLVLRHNDEFVFSRGLDLDISRTYNSQGQRNDSNGDNFRFISISD